MLYGKIITATGWRPWEVDDLTLCDVEELMRYWEHAPPTHVMLGRILTVVASAAGIDLDLPPPPSLLKDVMGPEAPQQQGNIEDLLAMFPGGVISAR